MDDLIKHPWTLPASSTKENEEYGIWAEFLLPQSQLPPDLSVNGAEEQGGRVCMDMAVNPAASAGDPGLKVTPVISVQTIDCIGDR